MKNFLSLVLLFLIATIQLNAGWINTTFTYDGRTREYRTYVPANYDVTKPSSLIIVLHGLGGSMNDAANVGITNIADTANIILLSPQALDYNSPFGLIAAAWNSGISLTIPGLGSFPVNADVNDVSFISAIMDTAKTHYAINNARVYVCGASLGGFMTERLACEVSDRFAAAASVMGTYALALPPCNPGKVVPIAHFHGTADEVVSYNGELLYAGNAFPVGLSVDSLVKKWVSINGCNPLPVHETWPNTNGDNISVEHFIYADAEEKSRVELFKVNGGTHFWYQGSNTGGEIDYATEIWKFFNKQYNYANGTNVTDISYSNEIKLFPNPANDRIFVQSGADVVSVEVMDIYGSVKYSGKNTIGGINVTTLAPGIYMARVKSIKGDWIVKKFVKH
jgi:polyhydroxybutyrate depolymerase